MYDIQLYFRQTAILDTRIMLAEQIVVSFKLAKMKSESLMHVKDGNWCSCVLVTARNQYVDLSMMPLFPQYAFTISQTYLPRPRRPCQACVCLACWANAVPCTDIIPANP